LNILLRPGPYICSEWDFGGMPARLLANKKLSIRSNNKEFVDEVRIYFRELSKVINNYTV
jgi:beta-galactosidase